MKWEREARGATGRTRPRRGAAKRCGDPIGSNNQQYRRSGSSRHSPLGEPDFESRDGCCWRFIGGQDRVYVGDLCRPTLVDVYLGLVSTAATRTSLWPCSANFACVLFSKVRMAAVRRPEPAVVFAPRGRKPGAAPWPPVPSRRAIKAHGPRVGNGLFRLGKRSRECGIRRRTLDATIGTSLSRERVPSPLREKRPGFLVLPSPNTPGVPGSAPARARGRHHRRPGSFALAISAANSSILSPAE
jgi:hypothetical protein